MNNIRLLTIISGLCFIATGISSILTSLYLQSLGANFSQIAFIQASVVVVVLFASYGWGHLSDRTGRRKPMLVGGLVVLAIAYFFLSQAPTSGWAWGARVFEGIGSAAYATLSLAMMGDLLEKEKQRGQRIGIWRGLGSLGFAIGAITGGWIADQTSMSQALLICVGLYTVAAICALALNEVKPEPTGASQPMANRPTSVTTQPAPAAVGGVAGLAKRALPAAFLAGVFFWVCAHSASASMWPNYMKSFGYNTTQSGLLWGLAATVEMFVMYGAGTLSDRLGRPPLLVTGAVGIALTNFGYLALASYFPALIAVQLVRGVGFGSYTAASMTFAAEHGDQRTRGRKTGIFNTVSSAGGLAGTLLAGNLVQVLGFSTLYSTCVALALTAAVCFLLLRRQTASRLSATSSAVA